MNYLSSKKSKKQFFKNKKREKRIIDVTIVDIMKHSLKIGFSFGLTSGIITTLGLMIGLYTGTNSRLAVIGGILTIAVADSMSDAMGIHMSEESENHSSKEIWESTFCTFIFKFLVASTFIIPVVMFDLETAIIISIVWGLTLLSVFSYIISRNNTKKSWKVILERNWRNRICSRSFWQFLLS